MADIDFYGGIGDDNGEDGFGLDDDLDGDENYSTDDKLSPLQKLEKYMQSDNVYTRQMVARGMLDTIRAVEDEEEDCTPVLEAMVKLSEDSDPIVRSELMEQIPHLAMYCQDLFPNSVAIYILPMVVRYLNDSNNQVRKTSQAALLVLLEQELIGKADIEEQVVSVILDLASPDSLDDYRTEAVALMSKMSQLLGRDMTERLFLMRFCEMCTDPLFHVRKVCAANFGDFCTVVGQDNTERELLPKFYYLCEDGVWGVRKACAECFMAVSCSCSLDVRRGELSNLFVNLLCDLSRWVRIAAFQQLGPFISTFADSDLTGLFVNEEGVLVVRNPESLEILRDLEERIKEKSELVEDVKMLERDKNRINEEICDNLENSEPMDLSDSSFSNEVLVTQDNELSLEEIRAKNLSVNNEHTCKSIEQNTDTSISCDNVDTKCDTDQDSPKICDNSSDSISNSASSDICNNNVESSNQSSDISLSTCDTSDLPECKEEDFNTFQFWRMPLPEIDVTLAEEHKSEDNQLSVYARDFETINLISGNGNVNSTDLDIEKNNIKNINNEGSAYEGDKKEDQQIMTADVCTLNEVTETVDNIGSTHVIGDQLKELSLQNNGNPIQDDILGYIDSDLLLSLLPLADLSSNNLEFIDADSLEHIDEAALAQQQDIVPQSLLESYLGMADPTRAQTVDTEITRHCAYNLPAVAYTLGRKNWNCIKLLYETLAADMQWKVRRTLAFSIHEMAIILGSEITHRDLVPVFDGFLKDLDEVRIGVLRHFSDFLRLLKPDTRKQYLGKMDSFMSTDNHRNWRFRFELAEQLISITELFSAKEVSQYVLPLGLALCEDRVSEVRRMAFKLMSVIMRKLSTDGDEKLIDGLLSQLVNMFAKNKKWSGRQIFAQLSQAIIDEDAVPLDRYVSLVLPDLFFLSQDSVPNVRISVAKALSQSIMNKDFFLSEKNPCSEELMRIVKLLQIDQDRDVRYFSSPLSETRYEEEDHTELDEKYQQLQEPRC